jgi:hypothetical protein
LLNDLPLPDVLPFDAFWDRFDLSEVMTMMISDSHSCIGNDLAYYRGGKILNFDAHHDAGYSDRDVIDATATPVRVTCSNWAMIANNILDTEVYTFYPKWHQDPKTTRDGSPKCKAVRRRIDDGKKRSEKIDGVFVCRSGGWVPPWVDQKFDEFVNMAGLDTEWLEDVDVRPFSIADAEKEAELVREMRTSFASNVSQCVV